MLKFVIFTWIIVIIIITIIVINLLYLVIIIIIKIIIIIIIEKVIITHVLFIDDLKTYHKSESKAAVISSKLKQMFSYIGLEWGLGKYAAVNIKRGKIGQEQTQMPISHTEFIPLLQNSDHYKFLGKQESATHLEEIVTWEASKEYLRRCAVIWSSPLTIPRKIASTNNFVVPAAQCQMWSSMWHMEDIRRLDRDTRKLN